MTMSNDTRNRRRSRWLGGAAPLILLCSPAAAHAACELSIEPLRTDITSRFDPFETDGLRETIEVRVSNRGTSECIGQFATSLEGEQFGLRSASDRRPVVYRLLDERSGRDVTPLAGRSLPANGGTIRLAPGGQSLEMVTFYAQTMQGLSQGRYSQVVDLGVVDAAGIYLARRPVTLSLDVVPSAMIGVKGEVQRSNGAAVVELGVLKPGRKELPLALYVASTGGYRVTVSSENAGRLKHRDAEWYVSYQMRMGRHPLHLDSPDSFEVASSRARLDDYPLDIILGATENRRAGIYSDTVTFTVAAL